MKSSDNVEYISDTLTKPCEYLEQRFLSFGAPIGILMFALLASLKYYLYTALQEVCIDENSIVAFLVPVFCIQSVMIGVMGTAMPSTLTRNYAAQQPEENGNSRLD